MSIRRITKLKVNIAKCQTSITYDNHTIRVLDQNPLGFAFRQVATSSPTNKLDIDEQSTLFMKRHFGIGGCVSKTLSLTRFLLEMGQELPLEEELTQELQRLQEKSEMAKLRDANLKKEQQMRDEHLLRMFDEEDEAEDDSDTDNDTEAEAEAEASEKQSSESTAAAQSTTEQGSTDPESEWALHPNHCHQLHMEQPQRATIIEWPKEHVSVYNCAWHLKNCIWRNDYCGEYHLPNCYCDKIKETMDYVVKLMSIMQVSQEEEEEEQDDQQQQQQKHKQEQKLKPNLPADINVHIMNLNGLLNQLNQFLELQQQEQEKLQA